MNGRLDGWMESEVSNCVTIHFVWAFLFFLNLFCNQRRKNQPWQPFGFHCNCNNNPQSKDINDFSPDLKLSNNDSSWVSLFFFLSPEQTFVKHRVLDSSGHCLAGCVITITILNNNSNKCGQSVNFTNTKSKPKIGAIPFCIGRCSRAMHFF